MMVYFIVICINLILKGFEITCLIKLILHIALAPCFFITFADHIAQTRHNWFVDVERTTLVLLEIFFDVRRRRILVSSIVLLCARSERVF